MYLARLTFGSDCSRDRSTLQDAAEWYLASLLKNGQTYGEWVVAWCGGQLVAYLSVARPTALERRFHSEWSGQALDKVIEAFGVMPKCELLEDDVPTRFRRWERSTSLYLFTHAFDDTSPVNCGDTGAPVPLYLLPVDQCLREDLYRWASAYVRLDNIWLNSGALEMPAYRQIADPTAELSVDGRELCGKIESAVGRPVYYYVMRYWGRRTGESTRVCPLCGENWNTADAPVKDAPFHQFDFRCEPCRLVSHIASSDDNQHHAHIGEFKPQPRGRKPR